MSLFAWIAICIVIVVLLVLAYGYVMMRRRFQTDKPEAFDFKIKAYKKMDGKNPPGNVQILFVGSSVMEFWKTVEKDLAPLPVLNRGIGGSKIVQWPHYVGRLVLPYQPSAIVLYAGSNDMHGEQCKSPEQILDAFTSFASNVHAELAETVVYFLAILPSPNKERWANWGRIKQANSLIEQFTQSHKNLGYIDCTESFLADGQPRPELFIADGIHLNEKGYEYWTQAMKTVFQ